MIPDMIPSKKLFFIGEIILKSFYAKYFHKGGNGKSCDCFDGKSKETDTPEVVVHIWGDTQNTDLKKNDKEYEIEDEDTKKWTDQVFVNIKSSLSY